MEVGLEQFFPKSVSFPVSLEEAVVARCASGRSGRQKYWDLAPGHQDSPRK